MKTNCYHKLYWPDFFRRLLLLMACCFLAVPVCAGEEQPGVASLYASLNTYSHIPEEPGMISGEKSEIRLTAYEIKAKKRNYSFKDDTYYFPDTPAGIFFEDLSKSTEFQIKSARKDILNCNENPRCRYDSSGGQSVAFTDNALNSFLLTVGRENAELRYQYKKLKKIETYFTTYYNPENKKVYNPILTHFEPGAEETEETVKQGKNTIKFVLNYSISQGISGEIKIPINIADMYLGHEINSEESRLLVKFPLYNNLQFKVVRKTDDEYFGIVQMNFSMERFEETVQNLFNTEQGIM